MEFVFQILAELFSPVDEKQLKVEKAKLEEDKLAKASVEKVEETEVVEPNIFSIMDFH